MSLLFTCTALAGTDKKGLLKKDGDSYYEVCIGALNVFNSIGEYYGIDKEVQDIFNESSHFMRRIKAGCLRGEVGHPSKLPGMTREEYMVRIMTIREDNISHHIRSIRIDFDLMKDDAGRPIGAIIASLKPSGIKAKAVQDSIDNPMEDTCFSIRAFTEDTRLNGVTHRYLREVFTWDYVTEPGLAMSRKYKTPSLENYGIGMDRPVTMDEMSNVIANLKKDSMGIATESNGVLMTAESLFKIMGHKVKDKELPSFLRWGA